MTYDLTDAAIESNELQRRIEELLQTHAPRYRRLWNYYRNPMLPRVVERDEQGSDRPYRQAQEWGLPSRVTGFRPGSSESTVSQVVESVARKEVVIENDIAWRIDAAIDFLFGKPVKIRSTAPDPARRQQIETLLGQILDHNGGQTMLQHLAMLGSVCGFVDVLVKLEMPSPDAGPAPDIARTIRTEIVEPARALPFLSQTDWRDVRAYAQVYQISKPKAPSRKSTFLARLLASTRHAALFGADEQVTITELLTSTSWQRYEDDELVDSGTNSLGRIPLVHIQNLPVPFEYAGTSDVETLIPLQDELNTRLSDRANRITLQSFKMYLGKGIDGFTDLPIAPGRMWMTENSDAEVIEFGGDCHSPSEDRHVAELREAMDKVSGVTPIAAGILRGRIGHLTSAAALRVTLMALLARTQRKRITYGHGIAQMCELALAWLDHANLFNTTPEERQIEIDWPEMLPEFPK